MLRKFQEKFFTSLLPRKLLSFFGIEDKNKEYDLDYHVGRSHRKGELELLVPNLLLKILTFSSKLMFSSYSSLLPSLLNPHLFQTSLVARAIDGLSTPELRSKVCDDLIKYFETDTIW